MIFERRRKNSQRKRQDVKVKFYPNFAGQNGLAVLTIESDDEYFTLIPETEEEVKELLSQAHIIHHNFE